MPGTQDQAKYILKRFTESLLECNVKLLDPKKILEITRDYSPHPIFGLRSHVFLTKKGLLNVHIWRYPERGFWYLDKTIKEALCILDRKGLCSHLVLLLGRLESDKLNNTDFVADGYVIRRAEPPYMKEAPKLVSNGSYRIYEKNHLNQNEKVLSIVEVARKIASLDNASV